MKEREKKMGNSATKTELNQIDLLIEQMQVCLQEFGKIVVEKTTNNNNNTRQEQLIQESFLKCHQRFCDIFEQLAHQTNTFIRIDKNNKYFKILTTFKLWLSTELVLLKRHDKFQDEKIVEFIYTCLDKLRNFRKDMLTSSSQQQKPHQPPNQPPNQHQPPNQYQQPDQQLYEQQNQTQQQQRDCNPLPVIPPSAMDGNERPPRTPRSSTSSKNHNFDTKNNHIHHDDNKN